MDATVFLFLLFQNLVLYPQGVGDGLDEDTRRRMELYAMRMKQERARLLQELEQGPQKHWGWGALLVAALQHWHFWALPSVLLLLLGLWVHHRRRSREPENNVGEEEEEGQVNDDDHEVEDDEDDVIDNNLRHLLEEHIEWPVQDLKKGCKRTTILMGNFIIVFKLILANTFYPEPQRAIGIGGAFEGWSPREEDVVYRVLVPLEPPPTHTFHLELDHSGHIPGRNFHVRVALVCTCTRQQQGEEMPCFLHHPEQEQRSNEEPTFRSTLCTGSYLDVEKTARWFYQLVGASWKVVPQYHHWCLGMLPSRRSCKFKLTNVRESLTVEILFGVQQGNSDVFVSSQHAEALFTPSTVWPETYAVAETKFFRHIAILAPRDSWHLKCLQLMARALVGIDFSTYTLKTIVMHLLNTIPVSGWRRSDFLQRLRDIMEYLCCSLEERRLDHFIVGNQSVPQVIRLPPEVQNAKPPNLFHHLEQDAAAHTQAMSEYNNLQHRLVTMLIEGH